MKLSIIICTHNRCSLLQRCLDSLINQTASKSDFEVIVVDNNSSDKTKNVAIEYSNDFPHFQYVFEPTTGLSFARNTGYQVAHTDWVLYLDDDGKAFPNMVERTLETIQTVPFLCFGGMVINYFNEEDNVPRWWVVDEFETNLPLLKKYRGVCKLEKETPWGGIFIIQKKLLNELSGFDTNLGMTGQQIGYGEEYDLVARIRSKGLDVGIDTEVKIHHLVASRKLTVWWYIKADFAKGYKSPNLPGNFLYINKRHFVKYIFMKPYKNLRDLAYVGKRIIQKPSYHIENLFIKFACLGAYDIGLFYGFLSILKQKWLKS